MTATRLIIYFDISGLIRSRINTGIQRVLKEFMRCTLEHTEPQIQFVYINFDHEKQQIQSLPKTELKKFLADPKNYQFCSPEPVDLFQVDDKTVASQDRKKIFFDMDSAWNMLPKRTELYPKLKQSGYDIVNFIHDLVPILLPQFSHENTTRNFVTFLTSVYQYTDMVLFNSASAEKDFLDVKEKIQLDREIPTRVTGLGADFSGKNSNTQVPDGKHRKLLQSRYLLFVGTIEPRKKQKLMLQAFDQLAAKFPDLKLILIGKAGWKVDRLLQQIETHPLRNKQLFWFNNIDDATLAQYYQHAWIVVYLSQYEGYGLPIAESLGYHKITLTSRNSSMYEVGRDLADYCIYHSAQEIVDIISNYHQHPHLYQAKQNAISQGYRPLKWDTVAATIMDIFRNYLSCQQQIRQNRQKYLQQNVSMQFVIISLDPQKLAYTIEQSERYIDFIKEWIIVTSAQYMAKMAAIRSQRTLTLIDEKELLRDNYENFQKSDHVGKNWLLRSSLLNIQHLDDDFIMLDDDQFPLSKVSIHSFITAQGRYRARYFYELFYWYQNNTDYDKAQQNMSRALAAHNYEQLSYSVHAPQIINREIFRQAIENFGQLGHNSSIDEWSIYFNYANSRYPVLFQKQRFTTLNWPAYPTDWQYRYWPQDYEFENYYPEVYAGKAAECNKEQYFYYGISTEQKISIKRQQYQPYKVNQQIYEKYQKYIAHYNRLYGVVYFKQQRDDLLLEFFLYSLPKELILMNDSIFRLPLNYKILNPGKHVIELQLLLYYLDAQYRVCTLKTSKQDYEEGVIDFAFVSFDCLQKDKVLTLDLTVDGIPLHGRKSPWKIDLHAYNDTDHIRLPEDIDTIDQIKIEPVRLQPDRIMMIKHQIKQIPLLGYTLKKVYKIIRRLI